MRVLLTGGAGYIGSHVAVALVAAGSEVAIVDSFANAQLGVMERLERLVGAPIPLLKADLRDEDRVREFVIACGPFDGVIHLAGLKSVAESLAMPLEYYDANVTSTLGLLRVVREAGIPTMVFSSSATVYGDVRQLPVAETAPTPLDLASPYGKTKRIIEEILRDAVEAWSNFNVVSLRYFNPVGAHPSGLIGEDPRGIPNNLMPVIAQVAGGALPSLTVFGNDYPTPDGTAQRDYIHVMDLAEGHVAAFVGAVSGYRAYNLGTGVATSVLELVAAFERASGKRIEHQFGRRRPGDVAAIFADPSRAWTELGWRASRSIDDACVDHWRWQERCTPGDFGANCGI
jgi:UDP-glucose 4-epimerase